MDQNSPDLPRPGQKLVSRGGFIKALAGAATAAALASSHAILTKEAEAKKRQAPTPYGEPTSRDEVKFASLPAEEQIFRNFSPQERADIEEKIVKQKENYKRANSPLRAARVLDWEETTLKPILDLDVKPEQHQFWKGFLSAVVYLESEGKHLATSEVGIVGLAQISEATAQATARKHGIFQFDLRKGWDSLRLGRFHLQDLIEKFGMDISVLAYYAGPRFAQQKILQALAKKGVDGKSISDAELISYIDQYKINIANLGSADGEEYLKKVVAALRILQEARLAKIQETKA